MSRLARESLYTRRPRIGNLRHSAPVRATSDANTSPSEWGFPLTDQAITPATLPKLAFRWHEESGFWKIDIYLMPVQLVGGAVDGAIVDPGYSLDMTALQKEFEHIDNVSCNTHGYHGTKPPFVSVEGIYQG